MQVSQAVSRKEEAVIWKNGNLRGGLMGRIVTSDICHFTDVFVCFALRRLVDPYLVVPYYDYAVVG